MKTISDRSQVAARTYYYLLDFNDRFGKEFMFQKFGKMRLGELTSNEYRQLFEHATDIDKADLCF